MSLNAREEKLVNLKKHKNVPAQGRGKFFRNSMLPTMCPITSTNSYDGQGKSLPCTPRGGKKRRKASMPQFNFKKSPYKYEPDDRSHLEHSRLAEDMVKFETTRV